MKVLTAIVGSGYVYLTSGADDEMRVARDILLKSSHGLALKLLTIEPTAAEEFKRDAAKFDAYCKRAVGGA